MRGKMALANWAERLLAHLEDEETRLWCSTLQGLEVLRALHRAGNSPKVGARKVVEFRQPRGR